MLRGYVGQSRAPSERGTSCSTRHKPTHPSHFCRMHISFFTGWLPDASFGADSRGLPTCKKLLKSQKMTVHSSVAVRMQLESVFGVTCGHPKESRPKSWGSLVCEDPECHSKSHIAVPERHRCIPISVPYSKGRCE